MEIKAIKGKPKLCLAAEIQGEGVVQGKGSGLLLVQVDVKDRQKVMQFLTKFFTKKGWESRDVELDLRVWYQKRTLAMNSLMWALLSIMSMEVYQEFGHEEDLYQDMLDLYAPKSISRLSGKARNITSSNMNTVQMSVLIEGVFRTLAEIGIEVTEPQQIADYWVEWYTWRGKQKEDPMAETYESIQDYNEKVCYCEACLKFLRPDDGEVAHIVSKGAHGIDHGYNLLRLCTEHHIMLQHQKGWTKLIEAFPHLRWRVDRARELQGKKSLDIDK